MKKLIIILTALFALTLTSTGRAQSLYESAEELKIELRDLHQTKQLDATPFIKSLARIYELEEELKPTGLESQQNTVQRCERAIKVRELNEQIKALGRVRVKYRARQRLKPLLEDLQEAIKGFGPADDGECARLKGAV